MIWESAQFYLQAYEMDELQGGNPVSDYCTSCGVAWENHFGLAYTCRSLSEAAEERDEYKARLNTATETIKRLEAEIAEWRLASGVEGPLFLKHETAGKSVCSHSHS